MRLYYISFFYFNIILFFLFVLKIDLIFLVFFFSRKVYSIFKESLTEYYFQDFDGLRLDYQLLDLYENKLYVDFGLDASLEEAYLQTVYMHYALYDISIDFESYNGHTTFKWNDFNVEELNLKKNKKINFKKVYFDLYYTDSYFYKNIKEANMDRNISDDDYFNLYNYKNINRREIEEPLFVEENEKYYYNYLKNYFLKENFYDIFIDNNYTNSLNYDNFIYSLKKRTFINKYQKEQKKENIKEGLYHLELESNILKIKNDLLDYEILKEQK